MPEQPLKPDTQLTHVGRAPDQQHGMVNPPIYHASTVTFPTVAALESATQNPTEGVYYGRFGTPTTFAFEEAVAAIEPGAYERSVATSSGLAAITISLLAFLEAGDHLLMVDSVYGPTRKFCDRTLKKLGIETTYYDPNIGANILDEFRPNTRVVFCESPGSLSFEIQDIPTIANIAVEQGAMVILDNTWATPLYFPALEYGVDICIHAATKYLVGHADAMLGVITMRTAAQYKFIKNMAIQLGNCPAPEACWLGLRGLRTLAVRLERHQHNAMIVANWLKLQPQVEQVIYPALEEDAGHELWQRDFNGASGLFAVILTPEYADNLADMADMLDNLKLFAMGFSWGGYESLILPADIHRTINLWPAEGRTLRLHIGLEDPQDLVRDLAQGLQRLTIVEHDDEPDSEQDIDDSKAANTSNKNTSDIKPANKQSTKKTTKPTT